MKCKVAETEEGGNEEWAAGRQLINSHKSTRAPFALHFRSKLTFPSPVHFSSPPPISSILIVSNLWFTLLFAFSLGLATIFSPSLAASPSLCTSHHKHANECLFVAKFIILVLLFHHLTSQCFSSQTICRPVSFPRIWLHPVAIRPVSGEWTQESCNGSCVRTGTIASSSRSSQTISRTSLLSSPASVCCSSFSHCQN